MQEIFTLVFFQTGDGDGRGMHGISTDFMMRASKHKFPAAQESSVFLCWQENLTEGAILMPLVLFSVVFALFF